MHIHYLRMHPICTNKQGKIKSIVTLIQPLILLLIQFVMLRNSLPNFLLPTSAPTLVTLLLFLFNRRKQSPNLAFF